ncbi:alpha/beta hydrolase [Maritimibacter sp. 55A14]|uniref:alpha/beta hydrolase n=1 Tax=Maritimibacter sp. 55A14 TaxID=2174844 RepID=UPI000D604943|nr:alpha/beta hydrolase [Maritimibacter sp. 55A14]PWE33118.1 alpha/beta hydrolase [Maritimibacter sp. 55A14]
MITDWDQAYSNVDHVSDSATYPDRWQAAATAFRTDMAAAGRMEENLPYGTAPRQVFDLFHPVRSPLGLAVFVHGGYWRRFDKTFWSHLATGALAQGWAVAIPSYTLAPEARLSRMTQEIGQAVSAAAQRVAGPVRLAGHSAGGQLVARMVCTDTPLTPEVAARIDHVLTISGVHDLRPLLKTAINDDIRLDAAEAEAESPALLTPRPGARVTAWAGAGELPEFVRQTDLLANIWTGLGACTRLVHAPGRHHFNVIAPLEEPDSLLTDALTGADGWPG